jgi:hypothetical protein
VIADDIPTLTTEPTPFALFDAIGVMHASERRG